jgi:hypothetical protein
MVQGGNELYGRQSAVSASNPLIGGVVCLMREANPDLAPAEIKAILQATSRQDQQTGPVPNFRWGFGKLDALAAVEAAMELPQEVSAESVQVTQGELTSGGLAELSTSDNVDLVIARDQAGIQAIAEMVVQSTSSTANPSTLEVTLEGSVFARKTVNQSIELFDYLDGSWESVDVREASVGSDKKVTVAASGDLFRFVEPGTRRIEARIRYQSVTPVRAMVTRTDHFFWTIAH